MRGVIGRVASAWLRMLAVGADISSRHLFDQQRHEADLPFGRWGETFSDDIVAAMVDRLVHHAEILTLTGDSCRTWARRELLVKT